MPVLPFGESGQMKKTAVKIIVYSGLYLLFVFLVNSIFIRPGVIRTYGSNPSQMFFAQAFAGVFVPVALAMPAFLLMFCRFKVNKLKKTLIFSAIYSVLTLLAFLLFLTPSFSIGSILFATLIIISFTFLTISLDFFIDSLKLPQYWRSLIVIIVVIAMLTSVLWMNPIIEHNTKNPKSLSSLVNITIAANPAVVTLEKVFNINLFRSGNFYSHSGGAGLSIIGDYSDTISYWNSTFLYPLLYFGIALLFFFPATIILRIPKKQT